METGGMEAHLADIHIGVSLNVYIYIYTLA